MTGSSLLTQISAIALRSTLRTARQPAVLVSAILFPMMFFSVNAYGLDAATSIPGFPADSYLDFAFAFPLVQASLFGSITAGADLARDIESGFFDRLSLTPMRPVALLAGMLAGVVALGLVQGVVFLAIGLLMGVEVSSGFLGMVVLVLLTVLVALGFGGVGAILALRTGSVEAVESAFPLFFVVIFLSSINLPRDLIEAGWFRFIATINPVSYLVEGLRSLVITGWDPQALLLGFGCAVGIIVLSLAGAGASLRTRVAR
ncbi:MAG: ABC transporter permease [Actinomycetota bacterium]|jgi:ABC-2 type transport system permease protein|nr:ABC transporter permease [Rubrobacter sp.]MDQ3736264.1 ABC transporter permease [Actinomycetota bacterium]MDQ3860122.1 ABC transporter permease [Actinomycetota bacterium]MDQ5813860.1 ABC transporter permease [Actinomycetota bacterium]